VKVRVEPKTINNDGSRKSTGSMNVKNIYVYLMTWWFHKEQTLFA